MWGGGPLPGIRMWWARSRHPSVVAARLDIWTLVQDGKGRWLLADILGDQGL